MPNHIAVIMDGNGRWAKTQGKPRVFGHKNGFTSVREVTEAAAELGINYLTLYPFSTENWSRPSFEVKALMTLLVETVKSELKNQSLDFLIKQKDIEIIEAIGEGGYGKVSRGRYMQYPVAVKDYMKAGRSHKCR